MCHTVDHRFPANLANSVLDTLNKSILKKQKAMLASDDIKMEQMEQTIAEYQQRYASKCQDKLSENRLN